MKKEKEQIWWVVRAQSGDKYAFDQLLTSIQQPLLRHILSLTCNQSIAEEVLQEVFTRIYQKLRWLEEPALFQSWAYRIASREAWKTIKKESPARGFQHEDLDMLPADSLEEPAHQDLVARLPELLSDMPPASRIVLVLHYLQEMQINEIAQILKIKPGTVKSRLAYGLASLRRKIGEHIE